MGDLISRQAAIVECNKRGAEHIGYAIAHLPTIQPEKTQLSCEGTTSDLISRQAAIDALDCINGTEEVLRSLPPAQPEPTDINAKEAVYNLAEKIGIHQLFALTVELRGEPIQPEPQWIPVSEGLPKKDGRYQVTRHDYVTNTEFIDILWYEKNTWWDRQATGDYAVTAWMPLPEAYKEGGEKI